MNIEKLKKEAKKMTVFLAYNANIDAIVRIRDIKKIFSKEEFKKAGKISPEEIKSKEDLLAGIISCMKEGIGSELEMSYEVSKWLKENIKPSEMRMGGQIGIMSNALSKLGFECLVYFPLLSKDQSIFFEKNDNLKFLTSSGLKPSGYYFENAITKINWIFEFSQGDELFGVKANENSRFIAAMRPDEDRIKSKLLEKKIEEINEKCDLAILSGYHDLKENYRDSNYLEELEAGSNFIENLKIPTKLELGHISNEKIRKAVIEKIAKKSDVISMDTRELKLILELLDEKRELDDIISYYEAMKIVLNKFDLKCIEVHRKHYFMSITRKYVEPRKIKIGYEVARDFQYLRSEDKELSWEKIQKLEEISPSKKGIEEKNKLEDYLRDKKDSLETVVVPNKINPKPKITVGLGDIVSSISFIVENISGDVDD